MKTSHLLLLLGLPALTLRAQPPLTPVGDRPIDPTETQQLESDFAAAYSAANSIQPGPDSGAQRRAVANALNSELDSFAASHTNSAWTPGVRLWLAREAQLRSQYSHAMNHYRSALALVGGSADASAQKLARQARGGLAKLLVLTGKLDEFDQLQTESLQLSGIATGQDWRWAREMRSWAARHPTEAFKCGLYCVDQLGRLTQPGQFRTKDITETSAS